MGFGSKENLRFENEAYAQPRHLQSFGWWRMIHCVAALERTGPNKLQVRNIT